MRDPEDDDHDAPDEWRDCAEDEVTERDERADHEGFPPF